VDRPAARHRSRRQERTLRRLARGSARPGLDRRHRRGHRAALGSNDELTVSNNGLTDYEQDYINPIAQILTNFEHTNIRVIAVIEPDSLPNLVTNLNDANCSQANSSGAVAWPRGSGRCHPTAAAGPPRPP
jgi:hypothetical protein